MDPSTIIRKYYKERTKLYDIYMSHCTDVTNMAISIVNRHPELAVDIKFIEEAGMLHDIGIFKTKAPRIACEGDLPYICHGYLGNELLAEEGFPKHGLVCERHTGTGLSLETIILRNLPIPHRNMLPQSLEEKIICFADKFYSKSNLGKEKSVKRIRQSLKRNGWHQVTVFDEWCELFL
ncbi:MAG TPA: HDIG domain-containing protein [Fermentimonas sp.]|nr:HDIG domain-containing protein [Fermentimonas sp.]